jgi:hypothetical protein
VALRAFNVLVYRDPRPMELACSVCWILYRALAAGKNNWPKSIGYYVTAYGNFQRLQEWQQRAFIDEAERRLFAIVKKQGNRLDLARVRRFHAELKNRIAGEVNERNPQDFLRTELDIELSRSGSVKVTREGEHICVQRDEGFTVCFLNGAFTNSQYANAYGIWI